ncbi:hypothetical protein B0T22DRAFT_379514 [Podospora appendiculata]|uniref:MOSC domain-containing protein n=1 Tax=Podospora appendiculata TaxID=314037 RepID=A0AAE1CCJ7_9PEZI|nr:hypothetical protein B0T22DRAFT_379514 [Podospora appendiculata]
MGTGVSAGGIFLVLVTICVFLLPALIYFPPMPPSRSDALLQTHALAGVAPSQSGVRKRKKQGQGASGGSKEGKIRSLWVYPVKSCKGIEVMQAKVLPSGLEFDRLFTLAQLKSPFPVSLDASTEEKTRHEWAFVTQRQYPLLATVQVDLYLPDIVKSKSTGQLFNPAEAFTVLRFPWQERGWQGKLDWLVAKLGRGRHALPEKEIVLPVAFPTVAEIAENGYKYEQVRIWKDTVTALNMEAELPRELAQYLGVSNKLGIFRVDPAQLRQVYRCAPTEAEAGYQPVTGFQDAYPLHLLNMSSVRDLETKIEKDDKLTVLDPRRFRANIIVDGVDAYDEDTWKTVQFKPAPSATRREKTTFHVSCRTVRCKMPNVDPDSGLRHPVEPAWSLRKHRDVDEGAKLNGCLGMQLTPLFEKVDSLESMESWLEVGMSIDVVERGQHKYIAQ